MNLYDLKNVCAAYHNKVAADLTIDGVDLFLLAANNAKKSAERLHNFELEWIKATISVDYITGGLFSAATILPADIFSGIKEILSVSGTVNNCVVPIRFTRPKGVPQSYDWNIPRYPTDGQVTTSGSSCPFGLVFRGDQINIYPTQTTAGTLPINIEGYGWLNDYDAIMVADDDADPQDFLISYGFDFLQWSIIIELNYVFQTFVNRQEGNVGVPTKMRDDAWEDLIDWDSNRIDPHIRDTR